MPFTWPIKKHKKAIQISDAGYYRWHSTSYTRVHTLALQNDLNCDYATEGSDLKVNEQQLGLSDRRIIKGLLPFHPEVVMRHRRKMLGFRSPYILISSLFLAVFEGLRYPSLRGLSPLRKLKDTLEETPILVVANGSSSDELDWDKVKQLQNQGKLVIMCMNSFFSTNGAQKIVPDYYVLSDPIHNLSRGTESSARVWDYLIANRITTFVPRGWIRQAPKLKEEQIAIEFEDRGVFLGQKPNPTWLRSFSSVTSQKALNLAHYLSRGIIYAAGLDHSGFLGLSLSKEGKTMIERSLHSKGGSTQPETFFIEPLGTQGIADIFFGISQVLWSFTKYFSHMDIVNLSDRSYVDAFPFGDPMQLMKTKKEK